MSNKITSMIADYNNWYNKLNLFGKIICNILRLKYIYRSAYFDGWDSFESLMLKSTGDGGGRKKSCGDCVHPKDGLCDHVAGEKRGHEIKIATNFVCENYRHDSLMIRTRV